MKPLATAILNTKPPPPAGVDTHPAFPGLDFQGIRWNRPADDTSSRRWLDEEIYELHRRTFSPENEAAVIALKAGMIESFEI